MKTPARMVTPHLKQIRFDVHPFEITTAGSDVNYTIFHNILGGSIMCLIPKGEGKTSNSRVFLLKLLSLLQLLFP